ncbi:AAA family ATPase [Mucilaginibacter sp.]|uniref:AAA family ATPase n=1 Tax=Mucilaginibacter sp. TaxID=1882438 RepID=UPI00283D2DFD|nr:AAA family ATPase [Mucilaginibacter sp.]MDR3697686.1 AAA family ATPase [Mucilaginibacter sp.]
MIIKTIELNNFRIYHGLNVIDLSKDSDKNIFIVSGWNGFGKTTFLMSLVWCLYGRQMEDVDDLYKKEIVEQGGYTRYINNALNRLAEVQGDYSCHVAITFTDVTIPELPCREIKVIRSYNKLTGSNDVIDILIDGYPNELTKEVGPETFIRDFILPKEIAKFFFFDAEKIVSLAEVSTLEQRKNLSLAYSEVLGIKKYEDLKKGLEELQYKLRKDAANFKERNELVQLEADREIHQNLINENTKILLELVDVIASQKQQLNTIQERLIKAGSKITVEELNELRIRDEELTRKAEKLSEELKESFDLVPFAIAGHVLLNVHVQLELEANIKAAEFQTENVNQKTESVINELLDAEPDTSLFIPFKVKEFYADTLRVLIKKHFFSEVLDLPDNTDFLHDFSESERKEFNALVSNIKNSFKESFKRISGDNVQVKNELGTIRKKLRDAEANEEDPLIAELKRQKDRLEFDVESNQRKRFELENQNLTKEKEIHGKGQQIQELTKRLKVSEQNKDKDQKASDLIHYLKNFIATFKEEKKKSLEDAILSGLHMLMHKKDFISKVEVEIISDIIDIKLYNARNQEIKTGSLSKGEQQMYATALLRGLVEESDIAFPVFIDSPMQKFDEQHSENIVKYFYPSVSEQVVIFPLINKELSAKEYD